MYIYDSTSLNVLRTRNISDKRCRENQNAFYVPQFFPENGDVYEIMRKNMVKRSKPLMTEQYGACALQIGNLGYRHTDIICNNYYHSIATMFRRTLLHITLYVHCLSCCSKFYKRSSG